MVVAPRPVFFPHPALQVLSAMIHFLGTSQNIDIERLGQRI